MGRSERTVYKGKSRAAMREVSPHWMSSERNKRSEFKSSGETRPWVISELGLQIRLDGCPLPLRWSQSSREEKAEAWDIPDTASRGSRGPGEGQTEQDRELVEGHGE